ncbi:MULTISPECIES: hypothetical protein [Bacillus]|jgi:FtsH-binding integral membrane protein|uniref:hypothetical protein n=1 Tax=Bacillus TaxID=1386 RepID=UPI001653C029|nr:MULTISPECIES: hypothetical protein [Bacillus]MCR6612495.1 hypothetical protein [Bacillus infantis]MDT0162423.1 hypothetical protein [Bacillus sp. AG4(2022)]
MLQTAALYLSFIMAVFLLAFSYFEGIKIADSEEKVYGGTFIFTTVSGFIFSGLTYAFI